MITYDRYLAILAESDAAVRAAAEAAFVKLLEKIRAGQAPRSAIDAILKEFNGGATEGFREALNAILASSLGPKEIKAYPVGRVKLSDALYANAKAVSASTQQIIEKHMQGLHDARELRKALYEGYDFQNDPLNVVKPLPKYLQVEFDQFKAAALKTPALRAAYLEAIRKAESGAGMDAVEKALKVAFYERNRYYANRIARTELHRNYTDQVAKELMEEEQIEYVQWRMSSKHPKTDICCRAGTLITTAEGLKPIELVAMSDRVLTHRGRWKSVTRLYRRELGDTDILVVLTIQTESGRSHQVTLTPNHPVLTAQGWIPAGDLKIGCRGFSAENAYCNLLAGDAFCKAPSDFLGNWITRGLRKAFSELCDEFLAWTQTHILRMLNLCFLTPKFAHMIDDDICRYVSLRLSNLGCLAPSSILINKYDGQENVKTFPDDACHNLDYLCQLSARIFLNNTYFLCNLAIQNFSRMFYRLKALLHGLGSNKYLSNISLDCFCEFQKIFRKFRIEPLSVFVEPLPRKRESNKADFSLLNQNHFDNVGKFSSLQSPDVKSYINYSMILGKKIVQSRGEPVFNLGVAEDQSYVAGGLVVHNCDLHAKLDAYGLGPGVYPKADAPKPPAHPFCLCVVSPRIDIDPTKPPRFNPKAERAFLANLPAKEARAVAGSWEKRRRVLEDGDTLEAIYNEGQDELYKWKRLGQFGTPIPKLPPILPPEFDEYPVPAYRKGTTLAEAKKMAQEILDAKGPVDYAKRTNGLEINRFRHIGSKDPVTDRYGKASAYSFDPELANAINEGLVEMAKEADRLGIPRLRGITGKGSGSCSGSMGDGVLFINPRDKKIFTNINLRDFLQEQLDGADENLVLTNIDLEHLSEEQFLVFRSHWQEMKDDASAKLARLNSGESEAKVMGSQWKFGDDPKKRPYGSADYQFGGKLNNTMWHEFGHHIHQQLGVVDSGTYKNPPMETLLKDLYSKCKDRPTGYSATNQHEWFAESFALYKQGREDLVPPPLLELIKHLYATGGKLP